MGEEIPNAQVFAPLFRRCAHAHESAYLHDVSCQYLEISGNLQNPRNFGYTFNAMGHLTAVSENTNLNNYAAAVTNDANGNITQVTETWNGQFPLASTLAYDYENRLTQHATGMLGITVAHKYDGLGRLVRTDRTTAGPTTTQFEHVRDGLKLVGNIDATNTNTAPTWTNKPGALRPVESQQVVTNSATQYINVSDEISPARRTYNPSTSAAGDTEAIAAKGKLVLVNGATPALTASLAVNPSEVFSQRNMTYNENSIALPSDRGTLEISGANLMYEGARVKSWMLGRDVNPAGRGDGSYYAQGGFSIGSVRPSPTTTPVGGWGNSVNNPGWVGPPDPNDPCQNVLTSCPYTFACDYSEMCNPYEWQTKTQQCCERLENIYDWCHPECVNDEERRKCWLKHCYSGGGGGEPPEDPCIKNCRRKLSCCLDFLCFREPGLRIGKDRDGFCQCCHISGGLPDLVSNPLDPCFDPRRLYNAVLDTHLKSQVDACDEAFRICVDICGNQSI